MWVTCCSAAMIAERGVRDFPFSSKYFMSAAACVCPRDKRYVTEQ
jgi:hypothetical protein